MIQMQFNTKIQVLRTDNGTEYSCVDTPQQNRIAERKKHILDVARDLMSTTNMLIFFRGMLFSLHLIS